MKRLAVTLLERALGTECAQSVLGDLEEDLAHGRSPWWAARAPGAWLFWQAIVHAVAARWDERSPEPRRTLELTTMWHDVRHAIRSLRSAPSFTVVALIVLSLGIGASTAIYSVVDAVVLRALPYDGADRLVEIGIRDQRTGAFESYQPPQNFIDWRTRQNVFAAMTATMSSSGFSVNENGVPRDLLTLQVTNGYFDVYRAHPQLGQVFTEQHHERGHERVALISDGLWRRQFGADPNVIGKTLQSTAALIYGVPLPVPTGTWTIVGVMPRGFRSPVSGRQTDVWVPFVVPENQRTRDGSRSAPLVVTGRLGGGVSLEQADAQIRTITASLAEAYPAWFEGDVGAVRTLHDATVGDVRAWMLLLLGAVGVVLLITCMNVASLMVARTMARTREIETRAALGASRWRIARGLIVESLVLAAAGTLLGLIVAFAGVDVLRGALPEALPRPPRSRWTSGCSVSRRSPRSRPGCCSASRLPCCSRGRDGSTPCASEAARPPAVRACARRSSSPKSRWPSCSRSAPVSSSRARPRRERRHRARSSQRAHDAALAEVRFVEAGRGTPAMARVAAAVPEIVDRINRRPGVVSAAFIAGNLPFTGYSARFVVRVPGRQQPFEGRDRVEVRYVTPGYARAIGTRIMRGRYLEPGDTNGAAPVVVLNEEAVARYFGGREPLGATITIERNVQQATIVGVVGDVKLAAPRARSGRKRICRRPRGGSWAARLPSVSAANLPRTPARSARRSGPRSLRSPSPRPRRWNPCSGGSSRSAGSAC